MLETETIASAKSRLRRQALAASRRAHHPIPTADAFATLLAGIVDRLGVTRVAGFWPMRDEPDLVPFMTAFAERGGTLLLPCIVDRDCALRFDRWRPERGLRPGPLGTRVPDASADDLDLTPDLILVPLLAFDRACRRLGRGGGFYDRTLLRHACRPAVGVAFAERERPEIPSEPHDRALDAIVTEHATILAHNSRIVPA